MRNNDPNPWQLIGILFGVTALLCFAAWLASWGINLF